MLQSLLSSLKANASNDGANNESKRRHPRRSADRCVAVIHGQTFPIENWSQGGVLINADERLFSVGHNIDVTLKFKLRNTIVDTVHKAEIIRKTSGHVAVKFAPLTSSAKRAFKQVIDDYAAREFATSQA